MTPQDHHEAKGKQCNHKNCPKGSIIVCQARVCCTNQGCGKFFCEEHYFRGCIPKSSKNMIEPTPCFDCAPKVTRRAWFVLYCPLICFCAIPMTIWMIMLLAAGINESVS